MKIDKIGKHNKELVLHGDIYDEAEQIAINLARKKGLTYSLIVGERDLPDFLKIADILHQRMPKMAAR